MDITSKWANPNGNGKTIERQSYTVGDVTYTVDGKHVVLTPSEKEKKIAELLAEKYGKKIRNRPQNQSTTPYGMGHRGSRTIFLLSVYHTLWDKSIPF